jgi:hypothetical protein
VAPGQHAVDVAPFTYFDPVKKHADMLIGWNSTEMPAGFAEYDSTRLDEVEILARKYGLLQ